MNQIKQRLKDYLATSLTVNEIFLACAILLVNFTIRFFPYISFQSFENIKSLIGIILFIGLFFLAPLFLTIKIIFSRNKIISSFKLFELSLWGTIWIMILIPLNFITIFSKLSNIDFLNNSLSSNLSSLSIMDYTLLLYLGIFLIRIILLFFLSSYLEIERFNVTHIPINYFILTAVTIYSFFVLFQQPVLPVELPIDFFANVFQSSAFAFTSGSIILHFYYVFLNKKPQTTL